ncbi:MAG TPA: MmgE/PrpD family protein, partial [Acidimicrobiales bacterium]|nr:MmgE/PrpD family protein [Acidimicrobiales bacterium]
QLADWIVKAQFEEIPTAGVHRVKERFIDSLGVQFAGMSVSTGQLISSWVKTQGAKPESTVVGCGFKSTASLATLVNATAGHALEFDDIATFSGHYANPMTAAALAVAEKVGASGREAILAWMVGYEVICQTAKPCRDGARNTLLWRGWFNQGFQPVLGVAALTAKMMGLDVSQTRMALGNAASAMAGIMKNRGSDTKSFTAGSAAMHGVMAAELMSLGFTANEDIIDGDDGVARLLGLEVGDPQKVLDGLGTWEMATNGSTMRLHASCGAGHWGQDALQNILRRRPADPEDIDSIVVYLPGFLMQMLPYHQPQTGLEGKYSIEYDLAAVALDGRAGMYQYTDAAVRRPAAQELMKRVEYIPVEGDISQVKLESRVVLRLKNGEELEETVTRSHGTPSDPLTEEELVSKFHECSEALLPKAQRDKIIDLCWRRDALEDLSPLGAAVGTIEK